MVFPQNEIQFVHAVLVKMYRIEKYFFTNNCKQQYCTNKNFVTKFTFDKKCLGNTFLVFTIVSKAFSWEKMNVINGYIALVTLTADTFEYNLKRNSALVKPYSMKPTVAKF